MCLVLGVSTKTRLESAKEFNPHEVLKILIRDVFFNLHLILICRPFHGIDTTLSLSICEVVLKVNSSCCPLRSRTTPFPEDKSILGVIYGVLLWADMNAATPLGARGRCVISLGAAALGVGLRPVLAVLSGEAGSTGGRVCKHQIRLY